jgi:hypothetical protein
VAGCLVALTANSITLCESSQASPACPSAFRLKPVWIINGLILTGESLGVRRNPSPNATQSTKHLTWNGPD